VFNEGILRYVYAQLEEKLQNSLKKGKLKMYHFLGHRWPDVVYKWVNDIYIILHSDST